MSNEASKIFGKRKVLTIEEISRKLGRAVVTARRRLKEWGACTSYNEYGRYYTLAELAQYNECGIWKCGKGLFSKYGNLKETFRGVVCDSKSGMSAFEISEVMQLDAHTFLSHFRNHSGIRREKHRGLYLYFSSDGPTYERQKTCREMLLRDAATLTLPADADAVVILVELIKHSKDDVLQLSRRVRRKGVRVSIEEVRNLLIYHSILKKKRQGSA